jgi:hypothetical protein
VSVSVSVSLYLRFWHANMFSLYRACSCACTFAGKNICVCVVCLCLCLCLCLYLCLCLCLPRSISERYLPASMHARDFGTQICTPRAYLRASERDICPRAYLRANISLRWRETDIRHRHRYISACKYARTRARTRALFRSLAPLLSLLIFP